MTKQTLARQTAAYGLEWKASLKMFKPKKDKFWDLASNAVIKTLTISDILLLSSFGLIAPIFAVFLTESIQGGNLQVAGLASTIYLLTKSACQIPVARWADKVKGEKDDFWMMVIGSFATSLVPLLYLLAHTPRQIYLIQFLYGLAQAFTFPSWMAIFTRHIDREKEGTQWGLYYTFTDFAAALSAGVGGFVAYKLGFKPLFILVFVLSTIGSFWLLLIKNKIRQKEKDHHLKPLFWRK